MGFGEYSLPHIRPLSAEEKSHWLKQWPLTSRIAFLQKRGASQEEYKNLQCLWEEWKTTF